MLHVIRCIQSGYFVPCCIKSNAFTQDAFVLTAWSPLNTIGIDQNCVQWSPCSEAKCISIECSGFYTAWPKHPDWMPWIPCSVIECSGVHAARPNASRLNAVDSMQHDWMQCIPCSVVKCILIERSVYHAAWLKGSPLNAVDTKQRGAMDSDWMQWIACSVMYCSRFHAAW